MGKDKKEKKPVEIKKENKAVKTKQAKAEIKEEPKEAQKPTQTVEKAKPKPKAKAKKPTQAAKSKAPKIVIKTGKSILKDPKRRDQTSQLKEIIKAGSHPGKAVVPISPDLPKINQEPHRIKIIPSPEENIVVKYFKKIVYNFSKTINQPNYIRTPHRELSDHLEKKQDFLLNGIREGEVVVIHEPQSIKGLYLKEMFCEKEHDLNRNRIKILNISTIEPLTRVSERFRDCEDAFHDVYYSKRTIAEIYNGEKDLRQELKEELKDYDLLIIDNWETSTLLFDKTNEDQSIRSFLRPIIKVAKESNTSIMLIISGDFLTNYKSDAISLMELSFQNTIDIKENSTGKYEANFMRKTE